MRFLNPILLVLLLLFIGEVSLAQGSEVSAGQPEKTDFSKSITLYPNPATEYVHIKLGTLNASQVKLTLYNLIGNEIQIETEVIEEHEIRVRVKEFSTGYYLLAVRDEEIQFRATYKFLKR
jgi:Secretion system C-terminal sorting domain